MIQVLLFFFSQVLHDLKMVLGRIPLQTVTLPLKTMSGVSKLLESLNITEYDDTDVHIPMGVANEMYRFFKDKYNIRFKDLVPSNKW